MSYTPFFLVNAVLGAIAVTVGLWFLQGDLSSAVTIILIVGLTILYAKVCPSTAHVWMWSTLLLGLESLAWPFQMLGELQQFGPEPPIEEMSKVFTAVLFGLFSGIFWLTFAYGVYRRTQPKVESSSSGEPLTSNQAKAQRKKRR
ncbi:hypothetical protein [Candidatus Nitronereus thalassa]|uniref:Transmembrane protein n=1 Tax=Candidatus Nitronereus thalassa TaxID=3020898 RepID=A0ABU3KA94_9BACT|nr:hypothetical protein [Candidatus Nitronereus thalassa]MDT7043390.1 hypothetical protein [Candidatus Nitronereus thalassa]